jgi:hypothetical protein
VVRTQGINSWSSFGISIREGIEKISIFTIAVVVSWNDKKIITITNRASKTKSILKTRVRGCKKGGKENKAGSEKIRTRIKSKKNWRGYQ